MIASSTANKPSYWGDQTKPMRQVFVAIAEKSSAIDPDDNGMVTAKELSAFMNKNKQGSGDLLFAKNGQEPIFGFDLANSIPIRRLEDGSPIENPNGYIPHPSK
jgi:hypothetical protein